MILSQVKREAQVIALGLLVGAVFYVGLPEWHRFTLSRAYEEMTGTAPFHSVQVERVAVSGNRLTVSGTMIKSGCDRVAFVAMGRRADRTMFPLEFDPSGQSKNTQQNRPISPYPQDFGPWAFIAPAEEIPAAMTAFVRHKCGDTERWRVFFDIPWRNQ